MGRDPRLRSESLCRGRVNQAWLNWRLLDLIGSGDGTYTALALLTEAPILAWSEFWDEPGLADAVGRSPVLSAIAGAMEDTHDPIGRWQIVMLLEGHRAPIASQSTALRTTIRAARELSQRELLTLAIVPLQKAVYDPEVQRFWAALGQAVDNLEHDIDMSGFVRQLGTVTQESLIAAWKIYDPAIKIQWPGRKSDGSRLSYILLAEWLLHWRRKLTASGIVGMAVEANVTDDSRRVTDRS